MEKECEGGKNSRTLEKYEIAEIGMREGERKRGRKERRRRERRRLIKGCMKLPEEEKVGPRGERVMGVSNREIEEEGERE